MRQLIQQRQGEPPGQPRGRPITPVQRTQDDSRLDGLEKLASDADKDLKRALSSHETLHRDLRQVNSDLKEVSPWILFCNDTLTGDGQKLTELEKTRTELQNARRQCELVKSLLADATAEKEILFEVRSTTMCRHSPLTVLYLGLQ
jgi:hypothetical protein